VAVVGMGFALYVVINGARPVPPAPPVAAPAEAPYKRSVAGAGIVEAYGENIAVGAVTPGVVTDLYVKWGQDVKAGDPLFKVDDRDLKSELVKLNADLLSAKQKLARLKSFPRPEEVPSAQAKVKADEQSLADARNQLQIMDEVAKRDPRSVSRDDYDKRRFAVTVAEAHLAQSNADLALLMAGTWKQDLDVAQADVATAEAAIESNRIDTDRRITRAPVSGRILQLKVRLGEYAQTGVLAQPLILLGDVSKLCVRVDVDENDAWRIRPNTPAEAMVRGNKDLRTNLKFERIEPYVIPKVSLTGDSTERVDTRVLQVIYSFDPAALRNVYVGQQMDVFIESGEPAEEPATKP
jgi:multidrug resistance efflux pump